MDNQQKVFNVVRSARNSTVEAMDGFDHDFGAYRHLKYTVLFDEALKELNTAFEALEATEKLLTKMQR